MLSNWASIGVTRDNNLEVSSNINQFVVLFVLADDIRQSVQCCQLFLLTFLLFTAFFLDNFKISILVIGFSS